MMYKIAVITRTKDRPQFLHRSIRSVADQTYSDYTHIIVNDGGDKAQVEAVIKEFNDNVTKKIKLFHRDAPSGAPDTIFNESIDRIASEYFAIHDDDDVWNQKFLEETINYLEKNKKVAAVVVRTDKVIETIHNTEIVEKKRSQLMPDIRVVNLYRQCIDNQMTPISTLYRRAAYEAVGKFNNSLPVVGDWEFGIRLLRKYDVDFLDPGYALAEYHHRDDGSNSFATHDHRYYTNLVMNKYLREELADGKIGVGYIMSDLKYNQDKLHNSIKSFLPGFVVKQLKKHR